MGFLAIGCFRGRPRPRFTAGSAGSWGASRVGRGVPSSSSSAVASSSSGSTVASGSSGVTVTSSSSGLTGVPSLSGLTSWVFLGRK